MSAVSLFCSKTFNTYKVVGNKMYRGKRFVNFVEEDPIYIEGFREMTDNTMVWCLLGKLYMD